MNTVFTIMLMQALLIGLFITGVPPNVAAQIPPEVRAIANTWAFLASMGRRCETRLEVRGSAGLDTKDCRDFDQQFVRVTKDFSEAQEVIGKAARMADSAPSVASRVEWQLFIGEFDRSAQQVFKAMQHMIFLRESEADTRKKPERGKKK